MRLLVTGASGYIGAAVAALAAERRHEVLAVDRRGPPARARWRAITSEIGRAEAAAAAREFGPDAVLHFAGTPDVSECQADPGRASDDNVCEFARLLQALGWPPVVNSSSSSVYGEPRGDGPVPEGAPRRPCSWYGWTKLAAEALLEKFAPVHVSLRYGNVAGAAYGSADRPGRGRLLPAVVAALANEEEFVLNGADYPTPDGTCIRDYVHLADVAEAHLLAAQRIVLEGSLGPVNIGTGLGSSVLEVVRSLERASGRSARVRIGPRRSGDPARFIASTSWAREALGWEAKRSLDDCARDAWRAHGR